MLSRKTARLSRGGNGFPGGGTRRNRGGTFSVSPAFCFLLVWFTAVNSWRPLLTVLAAAALHESGHLLLLRLVGARVYGLRLSVFGAELETDSARLSYGRELSAILAGPAANLCGAAALILAGNPYPALTGANILLCAFNLLPVRPLDGGRAVESAVSWLAGPAAGEWAASRLGAAGAVVLTAGAGFVMWRGGGNLWLLPAVGGLVSSAIRECEG